MTLAMLTDQERAKLLRQIANGLGLNYDGITQRELLEKIRDLREKAEKYDDLCR